MGRTSRGTRPLAIGLGLALASALAAAPLASAADGPLTVAQDGSGDYDSVVAAVAAAQDGDTVLVGPGTYSGTVVIDKDITLAGDGEAADIIIEATARPAIDEYTGKREVDEDTGAPLIEFVGIELIDSDATVRGLTIMGGDTRSGSRLDDGIYARGGAPVIDAVKVVNPVDNDGVPDTSIGTRDSAATITGSELGGNVWLIGASPTFEGNDVAASIGVFCGVDEEADQFITDCGAMGFQAVVRGNTSTGIITGEGTATLIEGNTLTGPRVSGMGTFGDGAGIVLWGGGQDFGTAPTVIGNTVSGYDVAVVIRGKVGGEFRRNTVTGNGTGISVGSDLSVSGNTVSDNGIGVKVEAGAKPSLEGNTIEGNGLGIDMQRFAAPSMSANTICNEKDISALGGDPPSLDGNEVCPNGAATP